MTTKHAATKLRIVVLQDVIGTTKHNKAAPGPAKRAQGSVSSLAQEKKDRTESFSRVIRRLFAERPPLTAGDSRLPQVQ